ncbi:cytochrome C [Halarcobacter ebronensis]|uniref:Cytochrome C n=2 Tax=Halarcobacter ebronensis TaxID=1462615 RepID=A0A4Q0YIX8_9BACT|nr:cytochrome C [Halarcobacter ebronensis]
MLDKGKALYLKCAGCHGASAEKPALGKSLVIKGWSKEQIVSALEGYKNGTYGAVMKGVMKSQVSSMTKEDIEAVSAYIATF